MIELMGVSKAYQKEGRKAVDALTLTVNRGEIFGFIGPNGAGKTTTIKLITGILPPDEGTVVVDGVSMAENPVEAKRHIGYVPDHSDAFDRLTGHEYLRFMADIYEVPAAVRNERAAYYLSQFDITDAANEPIKSYSHGMRQKMLITGALLHKPPVWILDEPMTGLDPRSALLLKEEMRGHAAGGNCVFFSTHVLEVAERLCSRIGIISKGKLIAVDTLEALRQAASTRQGGEEATLEELFFSLTEE